MGPKAGRPPRDTVWRVAMLTTDGMRDFASAEKSSPIVMLPAATGPLGWAMAWGGASTFSRAGAKNAPRDGGHGENRDADLDQQGPHLRLGGHTFEAPGQQPGGAGIFLRTLALKTPVRKARRARMRPAFAQVSPQNAEQ